MHLPLPEPGLAAQGRDPSLPVGTRRGDSNAARETQHAGLPPTLSVLLTSPRNRQHAASIKMCSASPPSSLCLSLCLCKMGLPGEPDGLPGEPRVLTLTRVPWRPARPAGKGVSPVNPLEAR